MSLFTVSDFSLPTTSACPHCSRIGNFRKVTTEEYNVYQHGSSHPIAMLGNIGSHIAKAAVSPKDAVKLGEGIFNIMVGGATPPSLLLMKCNSCEKFVVRCPRCDKMQRGFPGDMKNLAYTCIECKSVLSD